jgi:hypothetical protein
MENHPWRGVSGLGQRELPDWAETIGAGDDHIMREDGARATTRNRASPRAISSWIPRRIPARRLLPHGNDFLFIPASEVGGRLLIVGDLQRSCLVPCPHPLLVLAREALPPRCTMKERIKNGVPDASERCRVCSILWPCKLTCFL